MRDSTRGASSTSQQAGRQGGNTARTEYVCSCGRAFDDELRLSRHRSQTSCRTAPEEECMVCEPDEEIEADAELFNEQASNVADAFLEQCTELRYEHHFSGADMVRTKDVMRTMASRQTDALKKALAPHMLADTSLDDLIDPIMKATDRYHSSFREGTARKAGQAYQVAPVRRSLGTHPVKYDAGGGVMKIRHEELFAFDIPLEQSLQRELMHNDQFLHEAMNDWATRPPNADGMYTSTQDGSVARDHPILGDSQYQGPARLAFAHYYDDVEVQTHSAASRHTARPRVTPRGLASRRAPRVAPSGLASRRAASRHAARPRVTPCDAPRQPLLSTPLVLHVGCQPHWCCTYQAQVRVALCSGSQCAATYTIGPRRHLFGECGPHQVSRCCWDFNGCAGSFK